MSTTEHIPGKWSRNIPPASKYPVIFAGRNTHVAMVVSQGLPAEEVEANCNLITAAPDMLEALEGLLAALPRNLVHPAGYTDKPLDKAQDAARAAIAKARGKE